MNVKATEVVGADEGDAAAEVVEADEGYAAS